MVLKICCTLNIPKRCRFYWYRCVQVGLAAHKAKQYPALVSPLSSLSGVWWRTSQPFGRLWLMCLSSCQWSRGRSLCACWTAPWHLSRVLLHGSLSSSFWNCDDWNHLGGWILKMALPWRCIEKPPANPVMRQRSDYLSTCVTWAFSHLWASTYQAPSLFGFAVPMWGKHCWSNFTESWDPASSLTCQERHGEKVEANRFKLRLLLA